jgi:hypothetical protein
LAIEALRNQRLYFIVIFYLTCCEIGMFGEI